MYICDHRYRRIHALDGPAELVCKLNHCPISVVLGTPKPRAPKSKRASPHRIGRSVGTCFAGSLEPGEKSCTDRQEKFEELIDRFKRTGDSIHLHMAKVMISFLPGLFVGEGKFEQIKDNLDLER